MCVFTTGKSFAGSYAMREYLVAWEGDFNKRVRRPYIIRYNLDIDICCTVNCIIRSHNR